MSAARVPEAVIPLLRRKGGAKVRVEAVSRRLPVERMPGLRAIVVEAVRRHDAREREQEGWR
jgi:hypothetical protein